ncbi:Dna-J like membrane chaperone protein [Glaciecola nitratireducens FR1064]|uniref:Co-chaperone protein DjlA n=2 Tax=Brumicola TaxID=3160924 RepID=G4QFR0_GLANF|nr:Dna-J like membrane chaperone protein [Glaciecola nitratireducens FR1064]
MPEGNKKMQIWGKVVGVLFGFMFGRVAGAILGLVVGHIFDVTYSKDFSQKGGFSRLFTTSNEIQQQAVFFHSLFSALGHVAKSDGKVTQEDIQIASALMDEMNLSGDVRLEAQQAFRDGKQRDFAIIEMLQQFKEQCHARRDVLQIYLEILIQASCATKKLSAAQYTVLEKVAKALGFRRVELDFLIMTFEAEQRFRRGRSQANNQRGQQGQHRQGRQQSTQRSYSAIAELDDAYKILGIKQSDDAKLVKKAYRRQMSLHHPDKMASKGLPAQALELSKQKAQDIQAAYELVRKHKHF